MLRQQLIRERRVSVLTYVSHMSSLQLQKRVGVVALWADRCRNIISKEVFVVYTTPACLQGAFCDLCLGFIYRPVSNSQQSVSGKA